jgi:very-short-patch-repair endonuclease
MDTIKLKKELNNLSSIKYVTKHMISYITCGLNEIKGIIDDDEFNNNVDKLTDIISKINIKSKDREIISQLKISIIIAIKKYEKINPNDSYEEEIEKTSRYNEDMLIKNKDVSKEIISLNNGEFMIKYEYLNKSYYDIKHILNMFKIKKGQYFEKYNTFKNEVKYYLIHKNIYGGYIIRELIRTSTVKKMICCTINHNSDAFAEAIGIKLYDCKKVSHETNYINQIIKVFGREKYITQYCIDGYRIDLYFPKYKLAIECDENDHKDRDKKYEKSRQNHIIDLLGATMIRFNPDDVKFNILDVISQIHYHIILHH